MRVILNLIGKSTRKQSLVFTLKVKKMFLLLIRILPSTQRLIFQVRSVGFDDGGPARKLLEDDPASLTPTRLGGRSSSARKMELKHEKGEKKPGEPDDSDKTGNGNTAKTGGKTKTKPNVKKVPAENKDSLSKNKAVWGFLGGIIGSSAITYISHRMEFEPGKVAGIGGAILSLVGLVAQLIATPPSYEPNGDKDEASASAEKGSKDKEGDKSTEGNEVYDEVESSTQRNVEHSSSF